MRKVDLSMNEELKYKVIKKLVDSNGSKKHASIILNCSTRTIDRLIIKYNTKGKYGFVHGNRNRIPATTIPLETKNAIIQLYTDDFSEANFTHFCEIVREDLSVSVSDSTINKWLRELGILSPKARRKTKQALKIQLKAKLEHTSSKSLSNALKESISLIDAKHAHPRRPRCKYSGEMIQMDASSFEWVPGQI